jgi:GxxExxY protein
MNIGYRADIIVAEQVLVELKAAATLLPVHEAQVLSYLKHSGLRVGLLINFNVPVLVRGVRRFVRSPRPP